MSTLLIITEDVVKIQTLQGFLGRLYSWFYIHWLKIRIQLTVAFYSRRHQITVLTSDCFHFRSSALHYSFQLSQIDYSLKRQFYWQITDILFNCLVKLNSQLMKFKNTPLANLLKTRVALYLAYHYLVYLELFEKTIQQVKPQRIILLGQNPQTQIASLIAKTHHLPVTRISFLSFSWLNFWLQRFFLQREYRQKTSQFLSHSEHSPKPKGLQKNSQPVLLSVDFYRHLKTLLPLYLNLHRANKNPWLVTDVSNLKSALKNFNLPQARSFYLASYLSSSHINEFILKLVPKFSTLCQQSITNLSLSQSINQQLAAALLEQIQPMIAYGLTLSRLYLEAGEKLFSTVKPKTVAVVSDLRFTELTLSVLAKKHRLRSVMISPNAFLDFTHINPYMDTDYVSVPGEFIKNQLIEQGVPAKKIYVNGDIGLTGIKSASRENFSQKVYRRLNLKTNQKIILLISFRSNWLIPEEEKQAFFQLSYQSVKKIPNTVLVIKPHPTEKRWRLINSLKSWGINHVIVSNNHSLELFELLQSSSVVLQTWSMTMFEAIIMNRPVICVNPFGKNYDFFLPVIKRGGAVEVTDQKQLAYWLNVLLNNRRLIKQQLDKAQKAIACFVQPPDGQAVQRVLKLLA